METRGSLDLIEPVIKGSKGRPGAIVATGVVKRHIRLELAGPREDVRFVDPVFDDPSQLGVARAPASGLSHMGKSRPARRPCAGPHPALPPSGRGGRTQSLRSPARVR